MTPLHHFGEAIRSLLIAVPLPLARAAFLAILIGLFLWVWRLPASAVTNTDDTSARRISLRPWALLSLAIQIAIYSLL